MWNSSLLGPRLALRFTLAALTAAMLAGCADSDRLSDPFSNPFKSSAADATPTSRVNAAVPVAPVQSRPLVSPVEARPLGTSTAAYSAPAHPSPPINSAAQPVNPEVTNSVRRSPQAVSGWSAEGGTPIVVAQGETAEVLGKRYGIPADSILRTNGFSSASEIKPGTRVVIPVYNAALAVSSGSRVAAATPAAAPMNALSHKSETAVRAEPATRETLKFVKGPPPVANKPASKLVAKEDKPARQIQADALPTNLRRTPTKAEKQEPKQALLANAKAEQPKKMQSAKLEAKKNAMEAKPDIQKGAAKPDNQKIAAKPENQKIAKADIPPIEPKKMAVDTTPTASLPPESGKANAAENANPEFRWPARGRIIQGFKAGGNDGINIAVPEGTSVKAAENGVVAYAGSELKGYGNLVLIRHPNGFVSAYAHNGDLEVKRGDTVKRGQTIAKSGQSGNVASPQLHFELRKGATPVDPTNFLAGL